MNTPWGNSDYKEVLQDGVIIVGTPSHGGLMIRKDVAKLILSEAARKRGIDFISHFCYEEDCDFSIAAYEMPQFWSKFFTEEDDAEQKLLGSLSSWNPDYLIERGVAPLQEQFQSWLDRKTEEKMRKDKHPDLIVSARGDWHTNISGVCEVITADDKRHLVTTESYRKREGINLLSKCTIYKLD